MKKGAHGSHVADALGRVERKLGKLEIAKKTLAEAAKDWRTPRYNADLAQIYFDTNDTLNALSYFEKALQSNPDHPVSLIGRARAGIARGEKIKVATDDLASLLGPRKPELTPTLVAMALTARAELKMFNRQYPEAIKDARDATELDRTYAPAHEALGLALTHDKAQAPRSLVRLRSGAAPRSLRRDVLLLGRPGALGGGDGRQGDWHDVAARQVVAARRELLPDLRRSRSTRRATLRAPWRSTTRRSRSTPSARRPTSPRASCCRAQKKYPEAAKAYEAALGAQPNFPEVHQQMGYILMDSKKPVDAAGEFEKALGGFKLEGAPREKLNALRDNFVLNLKKAPKPLQKKFADDVKVILH